VVGVVVVGGAAGAADAIGVAAGAVDAIGDAIGEADAEGDAYGVACAITLCPMFPGDAWPDGAATAVSPRLATSSEVRTPVLSRFNLASLNWVLTWRPAAGRLV
jgi:hypothetical protein